MWKVEDLDKWYPVYEDRYCDHCQEHTSHWIIRISTHERDSTEDSWKCRKCLWEYNGWSGEYEKP